MTLSTTHAVAAAPEAARPPRRTRMMPGLTLPSAIAGLLVLMLILTALLASVMAPVDPTAQDLSVRLKPPAPLAGGGSGHWLGTDSLGRDVLSRLIVGSRVSIAVSVVAVLMSGVLGTTVGIIAGYFGGFVEQALMRLADIQLAFPSILLALAILAVVGPGFINILVVLGATGWVAYARVIRAQVLSLREREYVLAARALGARSASILLRHILPNALAPLIVIATLQVASVVIAEASLNYLGVGVPVETVTWGGMLSDGQLYLGTAWWLAVFPGLTIMLTVLSVNLLGDTLRDIFDPRLR